MKFLPRFLQKILVSRLEISQKIPFESLRPSDELGVFSFGAALNSRFFSEICNRIPPDISSSSLMNNLPLIAEKFHP